MNPRLITTLFELLRGERQGATLTAEPIVSGPYCVEARQVYAPGMANGEVYTPGARTKGVYTPGIQTSEVCK